MSLQVSMQGGENRPLPPPLLIGLCLPHFSMASLPIVQLRHITTTDAQRQSVRPTSFALGLDILRKERPLLRLLPQVVTLVKLLCVLPCSTALL